MNLVTSLFILFGRFVERICSIEFWGIRESRPQIPNYRQVRYRLQNHSSPTDSNTRSKRSRPYNLGFVEKPDSEFLNLIRPRSQKALSFVGNIKPYIGDIVIADSHPQSMVASISHPLPIEPKGGGKQGQRSRV